MIFDPEEAFGNVRGLSDRQFLTVMTAGEWGASDIYWVEAMDANTLQCIGQSPTTENYPAQNVHETEWYYYWPNSATSNGHDGG